MLTEPDLRFHGDEEIAPGLVDLAVNVRADTPPAWLTEQIRDSLDGLAAYPDPGETAGIVAAFHGRPAAEVLVTAGAAEAFTLIARALRPARAVVVHPQFTEPEAALRAAGHEVERVILDGDFRLDPADVPVEADLVMVGNPTNPTSVLHPAATLAALARPGRVLVVDEAFADCVPGEPESLAARGDLPGLIVVRSLTKTWGVAGLRVGYMIAEEGLLSRMSAIRPPWAVSAPALAAARACCTPAARAEAESWASSMAASRSGLVAALTAIPGVHVVPEAMAPFVLLQVPEGARVRAALREAGFAVRRGDTFPGLGPDWLRVAVRAESTNARFAAALATALSTGNTTALSTGNTTALSTENTTALSTENTEMIMVNGSLTTQESGQRPIHHDHEGGLVARERGPGQGAEAEREDGGLVTGMAEGYSESERAAVYRVIEERRDVRKGFLPTPIEQKMLKRVLAAAHQAPSVGFSQPWDFILITDQGRKQRIADLARKYRDSYAAELPGGRSKTFSTLKIESILDTPVNIVVTCDRTRGGKHTLGRKTQPRTADFSSVLAVANLWLAARAEGLGVGWVSFFDERELAAELGLPGHLEIIAYLCVGHVSEFAGEPELQSAGWALRRPVTWAVHHETYGNRGFSQEEAVEPVAEIMAAIGPLDAEAMTAARERQDLMTKPRGALGVLEEVSVRLAGLAGTCPPPVPEPAAVAVFAGDHGVHAQGVTPWPQEVTGQMVANFLAGGAVVNAFAKQAGAEVTVVDVGVASDLDAAPGLLPRKVARGTRDFTQEPALTREEATAAIVVGIEVARDLVAAGNRCLITGDMGIANTTASAALICAFTGADPAEATGRGTGVDAATYARKVQVVCRGLELHRPDPADPVGVLTAFGGLEHAAIAGFILGAAALRTPVILDGVIAGAAALAAMALSPDSVGACLAGHRSVEPGHAAALNHLGLRPLVDLDLRLGEGTGAVLALPLVQSAARALAEVATFDSAGVTEKSP
jgi:nicotinate-nucleotide--dimethylbenzimidazole phosphoribosyltransferase